MYRTGLLILEKIDTLAFSFISLKKARQYHSNSWSSGLLELEIDSVSSRKTGTQSLGGTLLSHSRKDSICPARWCGPSYSKSAFKIQRSPNSKLFLSKAGRQNTHRTTL